MDCQDTTLIWALHLPKTPPPKPTPNKKINKMILLSNYIFNKMKNSERRETVLMVVFFLL